jgi:hypothetical protein
MKYLVLDGEEGKRERGDGRGKERETGQSTRAFRPHPDALRTMMMMDSEAMDAFDPFLPPSAQDWTRFWQPSISSRKQITIPMIFLS